MYTLYWIRKQDHTDILTQGYVGITKNFENRMNDHKNLKKKNHLYCAINKYGWDNLLKTRILFDMDMESSLLMEGLYRPSENIGWNSQRGGFLGVNKEWYDVQENSEAHKLATSLATKLNIALKDTKEARSERAKLNWINNKDSYKNVSKGSNNPRAILNEDQVKEIKYNSKYKNIGNTDLGKLFGVKKYVIWSIRSGRSWKHI